ncbi:MAG: hypothetical protein IPF96_08860 [Rhodobacter sp.]|jgi:hypothetical protein|nr:hypothetical protein [Rhodobacter sp.]
MIPPLRRLALFLTAAALASAALPALALEVYECKIKQLLSNGVWLPEVVVVAHEPGAAKATVNDPLIEHFVGKPIDAKVETENAKRTTFVWKLDAKNAINQNARFSYRLTVMKADLSASMAASPGRFSNTFTSTGKCQRIRKK